MPEVELEKIHELKGRVRFKTPKLYRAFHVKDYLERVLTQNGRIKKVKVNPLTATILVEFKPDVSLKEIEKELKDYLSRLPTKEEAQKLKETLKTKSPTVLAEEGPKWHTMTVEEVLELFGTDKDLGLDRKTYEKLKQKYGPNILPEITTRSGWEIFLDQIKSVPVAILGVASAISLFTGGVLDAVAILCVVGLNAYIGYKTESEAERTISSLKKLVQPEALVIREGKVRRIPAEDIVPGDIFLLRPGAYVPADGRIIEAERLSIDESALTGESLPVVKTPSPLPSNETYPLADRVNMCFMGTLVLGGQGKAVAVATGKDTEIGRIQLSLAEARPPETGIEKQLDEMGTKLVVLSGALCGGVFVLGILRGYGLLQMLNTALSLAVAAVPEGLSTVATTTLALGVREMRRQHIIVRRLAAIEALGSVQVMCLDKTGTITENRMQVTDISCGGTTYNLAGLENKYALLDPTASILFEAPQDELLSLLAVCVLCNESELIKNGEEVSFRGTPTETALLEIAFKAGLDIEALRKAFPRLRIIHRAENRLYMVTVHELPSGKFLYAIKGMPSQVLGLCGRALVGGKILPLGEEERIELMNLNDQLAVRGLRVLGVAYGISDDPELDLEKEETPWCEDFIWLGFVGMEDPIRPGIKDLIAKLHRAGIRTVMITGDQSPTAYAIGKTINISGDDELVILDSSDFSHLKPEAFAGLLKRVSVFSRVSPADKLRIVQAFQDLGLRVAMTGDGINDIPALKAADIGITTGSGTDVAKEVADIIIEDDQLGTMVLAVEKGRNIYKNIRKSLEFLLSTNMSEIMVSVTANVAGLGQPLNQMQLLWINLVTDVFPGLALSLEPGEPGVMEEPPRDPSLPIMDQQDFKRLTLEASVISGASLLPYFYGLARYGQGPQASGLSFLSLTAAQLLHTFNCRSEKLTFLENAALPQNPYLARCMLGTAASHSLLFLPPIRKILGLGPMGIIDALVVAGSSLGSLFLNAFIKKVSRQEAA
ncbi:cation-translocating P-type ATPase [Thermodesulfatator atlanticus]|uniref:cation-translocating P-type ATPase n=1 Tax=Thermodesulfatator atlanticus TaxID=501497 RepID=UPI0003B66EB5|nr:HAD-IC family P-type ATPase [Thermodesulfatator atlanticus]